MSDSDLYVLFCNERYGQAYEETFRAWMRTVPVPRFLVVRSLKGAIPGGWRGAWRRLSLVWTNRMAQGRRRVLEVEDVNGAAFARHLRGSGRRLGVIAGFNQILRPATLARFDRLYNFHPSLLPYYRGPVPSYWCIRNGEERTGVTLHEVSPEIDRGTVVWQEALAIDTDDPDELDRRLARLGAAMLPELLDALREGRPLPTRVLPAERLYRNHVDYASFPGRKRA